MEIYGADIDGIEGRLIRFTATKDEKGHGVRLLGLAQKVVREGYLRAAKAIETLKGDWSGAIANQGYTIDLSPAETPKTSSGLDLPIAIMLLQASILQNLDTLKEKIERDESTLEKLESGKPNEELKKRLLESTRVRVQQRDRVLKYRKRLQENKRKYLLIGKLDIVTARIEPPLYGMFGMMAAAEKDFTVVVPEESEVHASLVARRKDIVAFKAADLQEVWNVLLGAVSPRRAQYSEKRVKQRESLFRHVPDLRDIEGVSRAKRAMAIALAGAHNILLVGPPGQGKTMLATAATALLPDLDHDEMFELNKIYSAKGFLKENEVVLKRPFREAHSTATQAALFGGGVRPTPGLVSLAHNGVLLLDEINLFKPWLIEQLRDPLNNRIYRLQRAMATLEYPCRFIFVAAMNPCKCGWYAHYVCPVCSRTFFSRTAKCHSHPAAILRDKCNCSKSEIEAYQGKLSKPLLDRIDLKVLVSPYDEMQADAACYASSTIRRQIKAARDCQQERYAKARFGNCNADVPDRAQAEKFMPPLAPEVAAYLRDLYRRMDLTKRMEVKLLLVARTIADYEESRSIRITDIDEAVELMGLEHDYFRSMG